MSVDRGRGFTLVELMVVITIIGALAAIAIPSFKVMRLRAQRSELATVTEGIRRAEQGYAATWDTYLKMDPNPGTPHRQPHDWDTSVLSWVTLGFRPDGKVRGNYYVNATQESFTATGESDLDEDGFMARYEATENLSVALKTGSGVY